MLKRAQWALTRWWLVRKLVKVGMPRDVAHVYVDAMRQIADSSSTAIIRQLPTRKEG